jgi:hypothetical protein
MALDAAPTGGDAGPGLFDEDVGCAMAIVAPALVIKTVAARALKILMNSAP